MTLLLARFLTLGVVYTVKPIVAKPTFSPAGGEYTSAKLVTISDATAGATIHYTTNGTPPTTSSPKYTAAIKVSSTETIEAIATKKGDTTSAVAKAVYAIKPIVAKPTFSPGTGTYTTAKLVAISDATPGAAIHYTTDGKTPTSSSPMYTVAIKVSSTETIEAIATKKDDTTSAVAKAVYTITLAAAATPTFSPEGGTYTSARSVTISDATIGATIYYTDNLSIPTKNWPIYTGPITVRTSRILAAYAVAPAYAASSIREADFTITPSTAPSNAETGIVTIVTFTPSTGFLSFAAVGTVPGSGVPTNQSTVLASGAISNPSTPTGAFSFVQTILGSNLTTPDANTANSTLYLADQPTGSNMTLFAYGKSTAIDPAAKTVAMTYSNTPLASIATPFSGGSTAIAFLNNTTQAVSMAANNSTAWNFYSSNQDGSLNATPKSYVPIAPAPVSNITGTYSADISNDNNTAVCAQWGTGSKANDAVGCADQTGNATLKATPGMVPVKSAGTAITTVIPAGAKIAVTPSDHFSGSKKLWGVRAVAGGSMNVVYATINGSGAGATVKTGTLTDSNGNSILFGSVAALANGIDGSSVIVVDKAAGTKATDVQISQFAFTPAGGGTLAFSPVGTTQTLSGLGGATAPLTAAQNQDYLIVAPATGLYKLSNAGGSLAASQTVSSSGSGAVIMTLDANGQPLVADSTGWGASNATVSYLGSSASPGAVANPMAGSLENLSAATTNTAAVPAAANSNGPISRLQKPSSPIFGSPADAQREITARGAESSSTFSASKGTIDALLRIGSGGVWESPLVR